MRKPTNIKFSFKEKIFTCSRCRTLVLAVAALGLAAGCTQKKKDKPAYMDVPTNSVTLNVFQNLADPNWLTDDTTGNLLTNLSTISLGGLCSQGANVVVIKIDGTDVGVNPDCNSSGRVWTYSGAFAGAEGNHTIVIYGRGKDGTDYTDTQISKTVTKDTTPPTISGITFPTTSPYTTYNASITIQGTVTGGLSNETSTDATGAFTLHQVTPSGSAPESFDFQTTLNDGETRTITFIAHDKAGNASSPVSVVIQYPGAFTSLTAPISMYKEPGMGQTAPITNGSAILSNTGMSTVGTTNSATSTNGAFVLETGLASSMTQ